MNVKQMKCHTMAELATSLENMITPDFKPTLAIVFSSASHNINKMCSEFSKYNIDMVGCGSAGEIYNNELCESAIVAIVMDMKRSNYKIHAAEGCDIDTFGIANSCGAIAKDTFENPAMMLMIGGFNFDVETLIYGIKNGVGKEISLYGGLAGDDSGQKVTYAYTNNCITDNGMICLILDNDNVMVNGMATSGWEAVGDVNTITKAEGNIIYSINDEPALDLFKKQFGLFNNIDDYGVAISGQYPLQLIREGGNSVLRSPLTGNEESKSLTIGSTVKSGDKFKFSIAPGMEVIEQTVKEFSDLKTNMLDTDALILFSCKGRHAALGPMLEDEVSGIHAHWNKPMIGFMSYGEIGNMKNGVCEFHNETCSLILLKEK